MAATTFGATSYSGVGWVMSGYTSTGTSRDMSGAKELIGLVHKCMHIRAGIV